MNKLFYLGSLLLLCLSCKDALLPADYVSFINAPENGLHKTKQVGDMKFDVQYKPLPYLLAMEKRSNDISEAYYAEHEERFANQHHYNFKLDIPDNPYMDVEKVGVHTEQEWSDRLQYLAFDMKNDISLIVGQDTLAPALFHFERSYNLTSYRSFVLAFPKYAHHEELDQTLIFDSPYFNAGRIKFYIKQSDIDELPEMKIE